MHTHIRASWKTYLAPLAAALLLALGALAMPASASQPEDTYGATPPANQQPWVNGCDGIPNPGKQNVFQHHANWHCTNPDNTGTNWGLKFLGFHKQIILDYDLWRVSQSTPYPRIQTWAPGPNVNIRWGHDCLNGVNRPDNFVTPNVNSSSSEYVPPLPDDFRNVDGPDADTTPELQEYTDADTLGRALVSPWHNRVHTRLRDMDVNLGMAGAQQCRDMAASFSSAPRDPVFWRFHNNLDDVHGEWQKSQPGEVIVVIDRSGSMQQQSTSSTTKWQAAKNAAGLFSDLIEEGKGHRLGLVTFSSAATRDFALTNVVAGTEGNFQNALAGKSPRGATSIGDGLKKAMEEYGQNGDASKRNLILLMTDGMENTAPMIADVQNSLGTSTQVCAVGFGQGANLDGDKLTKLTERQGGIYISTPKGLELQKFFVTCYANLFGAFESKDPLLNLTSGQAVSAAVNTPLTGETEATFILGWEDSLPDDTIKLRITKPSGAVLNLAAAGVESSFGPTWHFVRVTLPNGGEQAGNWKAEAVRDTVVDAGERQVFISTLVKGLGRVEGSNPQSAYTTQDALSPTFRIRASNRPNETAGGFAGVNATVDVTCSVVSASKLHAAAAALATPLAEEQLNSTFYNATASIDSIPLPTVTVRYPLHDDGPLKIPVNASIPPLPTPASEPTEIPHLNGDQQAGDYYFSAANVVPPGLADGDCHFHAMFNITTANGTTMLREASYSIHVNPADRQEVPVHLGVGGLVQPSDARAQAVAPAVLVLATVAAGFVALAFRRRG